MLFWKNQGHAIKNFKDSVSGRIRSTVPNTEYYFSPCISWSKISSGKVAFRFKNHSIFDVAGACLFSNKEKLLYLMSLMNSNSTEIMLSAMSPTLNYEGGQIGSIPVVSSTEYEKEITEICKSNVKNSKDDWDSYGTSWDFKKHPLI